MSCPIPKKQLEELKDFVALLTVQPEVLQHQELRFFADYLESLGARLEHSSTNNRPNGSHFAEGVAASEKQAKDPPQQEVEEEEEEIIEDEAPENDMEEDEERMEDDAPASFPPLYTGQEEVSDASKEEAEEFKKTAEEALIEKNLERALEYYTKAIVTAPPTARLYSKRAEILLRLNRPRACIQDCTAALEMNQDFGKAFRLRGKAYRYCCDWQKAHQDIKTGQKIDFDEDLWELEKLVEEKVKKIEASKRNRTLAAEEKARKAKAKAQKRPQVPPQSAQRESTGGPMGPEMGGLGESPLDFLLNDPEVAAELNNPETMKKVSECLSDTKNITKYLSDPSMMRIMTKLLGTMGGMGGMPGMAGMPGMGGM